MAICRQDGSYHGFAAFVAVNQGREARPWVQAVQVNCAYACAPVFRAPESTSCESRSIHFDPAQLELLHDEIRGRGSERLCHRQIRRGSTQLVGI